MAAANYIEPLAEDAAWELFLKLDRLGFVSGIQKSIWGSTDGKRWEVRCTPGDTALTGISPPDRWEDGTAVWGARRRLRRPVADPEQKSEAQR